MRMNYVSRIQSNMKRHRTIYTSRKTTQVLDGSYRSVYRGRSNNFEELREYVEGDEVRDIDWKASARSRKMLVRQYIAEKKHNIMLVLDTNKRMLAHTKTGAEKRDTALMGAGTLACLVNQNRDYISATYATSRSIHHFPFKNGLPNIENILGYYNKTVTADNASSVCAPLDYILHHFKRRMVIIIVTDTNGILSLPDTLLKRLLVQHDVLVLQVSDSDLSGDMVYDVELDGYLPDYFTKDKKLLKMEQKEEEERKRCCENKLKYFGIASVTVDSSDQMETKIVELLSKHKGEKR